jgi:hypothetical protein
MTIDDEVHGTKDAYQQNREKQNPYSDQHHKFRPALERFTKEVTLRPNDVQRIEGRCRANRRPALVTEGLERLVNCLT